MNSNQSEKNYPGQQNMGIDHDKTVTDVGQGNDSRSEATEIKLIQWKQNSRKGEIRMQSGSISHKPKKARNQIIASLICTGSESDGILMLWRKWLTSQI